MDRKKIDLRKLYFYDDFERTKKSNQQKIFKGNHPNLHYKVWYSPYTPQVIENHFTKVKSGKNGVHFLPTRISDESYSMYGLAEVKNRNLRVAKNGYRGHRR